MGSALKLIELVCVVRNCCESDLVGGELVVRKLSIAATCPCAIDDDLISGGGSKGEAFTKKYR